MVWISHLSACNNITVTTVTVGSFMTCHRRTSERVIENNRRGSSMSTSMWTKLLSLQKNRTVRYGIPMLVLVVGGSFGLREFTQIRYDDQKIRKKLDPALESRVNVRNQATILEEEYENLQGLNLDNWKNIRGPRPWEDSRAYQDQQRAEQPRDV